jgi:hypothetical protein
MPGSTLQHEDLSLCSGTTLIVIATEDGILMAADDLVYVERGGEAIPALDQVQKVVAMGENILIGTCGMAWHRSIEYKFEDWIVEFIETHGGSTRGNRPSDVAAALEQKMRETLKAIESPSESGFWKTHRPGERIVNYVVAGYAESFHRPYIFEIGAEINSDSSGLKYVSPLRHGANNIVWFGEDHFFRRAKNGLEPEFSTWKSIHAVMDGGLLSQVPQSMQEHVRATVSLIKVEAQFNPKKVGSRVAVGLIDPRTRTSQMLGF